MARRVVRPSRSFRRAARPGGTWGRFIDTGTGVAASTKVLLGAFVLSTTNIAETIRRTVGHINFSSDQTAAAIETPFACFGMIVVSDNAVVAGATAIPGPITDASDDGWFVYQPLSVSQGGTDSDLAHQMFPVDSRAMRRVEVGFSVALMIETGASFGSITQVNISTYGTRR